MNPCRHSSKSNSVWSITGGWFNACLCWAILAQVPLAADELTFAPIEQWSNVFAGEEIKLHFSTPENAAVGRTVGWRAVVETAVVARRESMVHKEDGRGLPILPVQFPLPEGEPKTALSVSIYLSHGGRDHLAKQLWIYPRDPFLQPVPHLSSKQLVLFDPKKHTAALWQASGLEFRLEKNVDTVDSLSEGVLVIGEGVSFREHRGLPDAILQAASRGVKILCLSPSAGTLLLPGEELLGQQGARPAAQLIRFHLERAEILSQFDKHLDFVDWRSNSPPIGTTFQLNTKSAPWLVDLVEDSSGWPWLEAEFTSGGRIIVCGFQCIESWEAGPAARHALWHMLARVCRPSFVRKSDASTDNSSSFDE